ncbi:hypothetical protein [Burkholderia multivorans]|nr:hypothetical protein [Burkholderia multivorans]
MLMVDLLRASGYTASFTTGVIKYTAAQLNSLYGVDTSNACAVLNLLGKGGIPVYAATAVNAGQCPGNTSALVDVSVGHIWVKTVIDGTSYYFDPSFKTHSFKTGIDLASASTTGYSASAYLSSATSGATINANYVQNLNRTNIRNNLTTYANNLAAYLRANMPTATIDDVVGGKIDRPDLRSDPALYGAPSAEYCLPSAGRNRRSYVNEGDAEDPVSRDRPNIYVRCNLWASSNYYL